MLLLNRNEDVWNVVRLTVGRRIHQIHLICYVFQEKIKGDNKPLQFIFTNNSIILLEAAGNGESLSVSETAWVDSFAGEQDEINKEFIRMHGKWTLFNVSNLEPFNLLIEHTIDMVHPIFNKLGTFNGVQFVIGEQYLNFVVEWDECHIYWGKDNLDLLSNGNVVGKNAL